MVTQVNELCQKQGTWYFQGRPLPVGGRVLIEGVEWIVVGVGRSRSERQSAFLWIRNEWYGTTVYMPSLMTAA